MIVHLSQTQKSVEPSIFRALHLSPPLFGRTLLAEHYPAPLAATVSVALGLQEGLSDISARPPPLKHRYCTMLARGSEPLSCMAERSGSTVWMQRQEKNDSSLSQPAKTKFYANLRSHLRPSSKELTSNSSSARLSPLFLQPYSLNWFQMN